MTATLARPVSLRSGARPLTASRARLLTYAFFLLLALLVLVTFRDYGLSSDEENQKIISLVSDHANTHCDGGRGHRSLPGHRSSLRGFVR